MSAVSSDAHFEWPQGAAATTQPGSGSGAGMAAPTHAPAAQPPVHAGSCDAAPDGCLRAGHTVDPGPSQLQTWQQVAGAAAAPAGASTARSLRLGDSTALQLLPPDTTATLVASGLLPSLGITGSAGYRTLGYAVQPVEVQVEGQLLQLCAVHAVFDVNGQAMLCAQVRSEGRVSLRLRGSQGVPKL